MTNPITQAQNTNKCPHGLPAGTCPICNGMMGSSKRTDRDKPRVPGEMSYNECMAAWLRMQKLKDIKAKDKLEMQKAHLEELKENSLKHKIMLHLDNLKVKIEKNIEKVESLIKDAPKVIQAAVKAVIHIVAKVAVIFINIASIATNIILSAMEKISSFIGEIKNFIKGFFDEGIKRAKSAFKVILSLFTNFEDEEENSEKKKLEKIQNIIRKIFNVEKKEKEVEKEIEEIRK